MSRLRNGVNRAALVCAGVPLTVAGIWLSLTDALGRGRLPSWWPPFGSGRVWVDRGALARWRDHGWWTPTMVVALGVAAVLCLCWCALQARRGRVRAAPLGRAGVTLSGAALAQALAHQTRTVPGVAQARVLLIGRPGRLRVRVDVVLAAHASPAAVLSYFNTRTLAEAREVIAPQRLDAELRLRTRRHRFRRVR
ncbi:alkaline shock response membrane anchor protein AmaP [Streptomyces sp. S.PB5]|uniref:alkaline shock response membrane anchor protein AmaP n=1 Tax=Streptomyces sp. S.PB5 TaxID=3020844 RepID=UPI0025AF9FBC|nr:alkaline shock response membrane anchor protein AmaP [Streptomyces sp. S.PB5]MDN3026018.1 alkaline shock response membrane anchor protein AmaP [Streptomyces sp. S.PB5]